MMYWLELEKELAKVYVQLGLHLDDAKATLDYNMATDSTPGEEIEAADQGISNLDAARKAILVLLGDNSAYLIREAIEAL
jgi:hypothetical protein